MAYLKSAHDNCVDFYLDVCLEGESKFSICNNINDSQDVNLEHLEKVKSLTCDGNKIETITFYQNTHYRGGSYSFDCRKTVFNIYTEWHLGRMFSGGKVRSVKI